MEQLLKVQQQKISLQNELKKGGELKIVGKTPCIELPIVKPDHTKEIHKFYKTWDDIKELFKSINVSDDDDIVFYKNNRKHTLTNDNGEITLWESNEIDEVIYEGDNNQLFTYIFGGTLRGIPVRRIFEVGDPEKYYSHLPILSLEQCQEEIHSVYSLKGDIPEEELNKYSKKIQENILKMASVDAKNITVLRESNFRISWQVFGWHFTLYMNKDHVKFTHKMSSRFMLCRCQLDDIKLLYEIRHYLDI